MSGLSELRAEVAAAYDALGLPWWPDPHPGGASPADEEYSRLTDPARYRVVHARARAWADALAGLPGVEVERLPPPPAGGARSRRGLRLVPATPGTLPLVLLEHGGDAGGEVVAAVQIGVLRPDLVLEDVPDCGCDACDSGSEDLLTVIDDTIGHVVGGPLVVLRGQGWHAQWHPGGGSAAGSGPRRVDFRRLMELCRRLAEGEEVRLPKRTEVLVGRSWLR